jgi:hypothetical protein
MHTFEFEYFFVFNLAAHLVEKTYQNDILLRSYALKDL